MSRRRGCGLPADFLIRRARKLSGGQAQREAFARALAQGQKLMVPDEPTSAMDVSVQAQILNVLQNLKSLLGLSMLFVTHNLKVVAHASDSLIVIRRGNVIGAGTTATVMRAPKDANTRPLMGFGLR